MELLPRGRQVAVTVSATAANLGPGFDSLGLALDWTDTCTTTVTAEPDRAEITGVGAETLPVGSDHLVLATAHIGLAELGAQAPGLHLRAANTIPQARGLGSSSAAIVAGLATAWGLARPDRVVDHEWLIASATRIEGHPDNVAPAVLGGLTIAWTQDQVGRAVAAPLAPQFTGVVLVPDQEFATSQARSLLPTQVPLADAVANLSRTALLVTTLGADPTTEAAQKQLLVATEDRLHQPARSAALATSAQLLRELRAAGFAAVISGAGPAVLILGCTLAQIVGSQVAKSQVAGSQVTAAPAADRFPGFTAREIRPGAGVRSKTSE